MVIRPLFSICDRVITVTGAGVVRSLRLRRDPVTTISSPSACRSRGGALVGADDSVAGCWSAGAGGVCCAIATPAYEETTAAQRTGWKLRMKTPPGREAPDSLFADCCNLVDPLRALAVQRSAPRRGIHFGSRILLPSRACPLLGGANENRCRSADRDPVPA